MDILSDLFMTLAAATQETEFEPTITDPASFLPFRDDDGSLCEAFEWDRGGTVAGDVWITRHYDGNGSPVHHRDVLNPEYTRSITGRWSGEEFRYQWTVTRLEPGSGGKTWTLGQGSTRDAAEAVRECLAVVIPVSARDKVFRHPELATAEDLARFRDTEPGAWSAMTMDQAREHLLTLVATRARALEDERLMARAFPEDPAYAAESARLELLLRDDLRRALVLGATPAEAEVASRLDGQEIDMLRRELVDGGLVPHTADA